jgi:ubiquinone/menaquinone biosynthesis C-methylase UbiE
MFVDRSFDAYQDFLLGCKLYWTRRLYPALKDEYGRKVAVGGAKPKTPEDVAQLFAGDTLYQYYAWLERHLQRLKYSGRWGLVPQHERHRGDFEALVANPPAGDLLELDPDLELPKYYTSVDIHQHPGGVWSDAIAGFVYERGARSTTPLLQQDKDLHHRFTDRVLTRRRPKRLIDLGCGFGKSTRPFYETARDAEIVGIDLAPPCLKVAARDAAEAQTRHVRFLQRDARRTGLPDGAADVVTSTMVLHEMPPQVIGEVIDESFRLLAPGGLMIHLDFLETDDPFAKFVYYGHSRRNNEPYMPPLDRMGIAARIESAGFRNVKVEPFEEMPGTLAPEFKNWRFPWVVISAEK